MDTLTARCVFPVSGPPIPGGCVTIDQGRILAVGEKPAGGEVRDLGNVALLPGLVNAHTHLEFSHLEEPIGRAGLPFVEWIRQIIEQFRRSEGTSPDAISRGLQESIRAGTTALGEIAQPGRSIEEIQQAEMRATIFLELIAPTEQRIPPLLELAPKYLETANPSDRWRPGLSPHAPYTVLPELFEAAVSLSATAGVPVAFHLAESREELDLLRHRSGPFAEHWEELGTCDPSTFAPETRPLDYLRQLAKADRALIVHGNYLDDEEISFLGKHRDRMSVVYCPRTHAFFGHDPYPLQEMLAAGVRVALGTDSRASSPDLSVLAEMRTVAQTFPKLDPAFVLRLATLNGAEALGQADEIGTLQPGKSADLTAVALPGHEAADPHTLLLESNQPVVATWCRGRKVWSSV